MKERGDTAADRQQASLNQVSLAALLFWSAALSGLLWWAVAKEQGQVLDYARLEAKANFNKDMALRSWATRRGGVYVLVSEQTPPNPYLAHLPDRDVRTSAGKQLTLMNPAYMLRQIMDEFSELYGIRGRITSLKPSNPINAPDAWETAVLKQFDQGVLEVSEVAEIGGRPHLRYMRAFFTQEACLKCHAHQGYKAGDVRGGIGISVPLEPYALVKDRKVKALLVSYGLLWLLGLGGIAAVKCFASRQIRQRRQMEAALLAEKERLELVLEGTGLGIWDWNPQTNAVFFDERWASMIGCTLAELKPDLETWKARVHPDDLAACYHDLRAHMEGKTAYYSNIHRMRHRDGSWRHILDRGRIIERDAAGRPLRFSGTHTDITKLMETEEALREQSAELGRLNAILAQQAMYDGLTQVHNRRAFDQRLEEDWLRWREQGAVFSLLIADIDFFKRYNDSYGHLNGDACLRAVALALQKTAARANDFTARYGGEEFILLLPGTEIEQAMLVAEKARQAVERLALPHGSSDCAAVVTLSVGAASARQAGSRDGSRDLLALADQALYAAKKAGRNRTARL